MYALFGSLLGTIVGVLPGIGSAGALAMMLPIILASTSRLVVMAMQRQNLILLSEMVGLAALP